MACDPLCIGSIPEKYDAAGCEFLPRKYGYSVFGAIKCTVDFTDILTALDAGDIILGPKFGKLEFGDTTTSTLTDGCGNSFAEFGDTQWTFTTPSTADDYSDEDFWYFFNKYASNYTLFYLDGCEGENRIHLNSDVISAIRESQGYGTVVGTGADVPAVRPGFAMSITSIPKWTVGPNGPGKAGIWTVSGTISNLGVIRSAEIPGLRTLLGV
jgi:hypothetical protein